jgi:hypothetical protein
LFSSSLHNRFLVHTQTPQIRHPVRRSQLAPQSAVLHSNPLKGVEHDGDSSLVDLRIAELGVYLRKPE